MTNPSKTKKIEYGDFQTPDSLADETCDLLKKSGYNPKSILEPTCGVGSFFISAMKTFSKSESGFAFDIDSSYIKVLEKRLQRLSDLPQTKVEVADFFSRDWDRELKKMHEPILMIRSISLR